VRDRWLSRVPRRRREPEPEFAAAPAPNVDDGTPVVLYLPVRCPQCHEAKPATDGVHDRNDGRVRYHLCRHCSLKFRSVEVPQQGG